ncbi:MAG: thioredoxin family protein [Bacillota bacterium]
MAKKIEVFTDGSSLSDRLVAKVKGLACSKCEIVVYDLSHNNVTRESEKKAKAYGIDSVPMVVLDGKLVDPEKLQKEKLGQGHFFHKIK